MKPTKKNVIISSAFATVLMLSSPMTLAEQWIANCVDGKHLQFTQIKNGSGSLNIPVTTPDQNFKTFKIGQLQQSFYNGISICGQLSNKDNRFNTGEVVQICANKEREIIYLKHKKTAYGPYVESGKYCEASVLIRQ